jgi:hypothetical protein
MHRNTVISFLETQLEAFKNFDNEHHTGAPAAKQAEPEVAAQAEATPAQEAAQPAAEAPKPAADKPVGHKDVPAWMR